MQKFMQIKEYLLELSFLALLIRTVILGAGIGEALVIIFLVISMAYAKWLVKNDLSEREEMRLELKAQREEFEKKFSELFARLNNQNIDKQLRRGVTSDVQVENIGSSTKRLF